jgi:dTDP-4-amino-4,6-dideoxygalactose transaminase
MLPMLGIDTARPWGAGCHTHPAFAHCPREPLPITETLARGSIGLPFWQDLRTTEIERVCAAVTFCSETRGVSMDAAAA